MEFNRVPAISYNAHYYYSSSYYYYHGHKVSSGGGSLGGAFVKYVVMVYLRRPEIATSGRGKCGSEDYPEPNGGRGEGEKW